MFSRSANIHRTASRPLAPEIFRLLGVTALWWVLCAGAGTAAADPETAPAAAAQAVKDALAPQAQRLAAMAADPAVQELLRKGDAAALDARTAELAKEFSGALKLRLLPKGTAQPDISAIPALTYGSLAMITQAETGTEPVPAEVQAFGTPGQHVAMVQRAGDAGVLHLSLDVGILSGAMQAAAADTYLELRQGTGGPKPWVLASSTQGEPAKNIAVRLLPVEGTKWQVAYWAEGGPAVESGDAAAPAGAGAGIITAVIALSVLAAVAWLFLRRRGGTPAASEPVYKGAIAAIMQGAYPGVEQFIPELPKKIPTAPPPISAADREKLKQISNRAAAAVSKPAPDVEVKEPPDRTAATVVVSAPPAQAAAAPGKGPPESIFRAYDIRGVVGQGLTLENVKLIGQALGSEAAAQGQNAVVVGRDGRTSSPKFSEALINGLLASGRDVIDIGMVPTPVLYFATHYLDTGSGVMLTGSHNPPDYNGLKIVLNGQALSGDAIKAIHRRIQANRFSTGQGTLETTEIIPEYIQRISEDIPLALDNPFRIVVDCGNGVPGVVAPRLLRALGHDVIELYCDVDGNFPNHHPDPSQPENVKDLIAMVRKHKADLGFAFDGDGDRLGVVDSDGQIIWPDRQMMLFARDVLSRNRGAEIIYDVKCSRHLKSVIEKAGGKPLMWKTGHSLIKSKMRETGAPLAGEMSGHIFFKERWYGFDDALYAAARLVEILARDGRPARTVFAELPGGVATPELRIDMPENRHAEFMQKLIASARFDGAELSTVDGLRVDLPKAWGLIRPSNTTPVLVLRFEADNETALKDIQGKFRALIQQLDGGLKIPF